MDTIVLSGIFSTEILPELLPKRGSRRPSRPGNGKREQSSGSKSEFKDVVRVLLFGRLRELALYRAEVLRAKGFEVVTPGNREEALQAIARGNFHVAILTYTLSSETVEEVADNLRQQCPECPLIAIAQSPSLDPRINPDAIVIADHGPSALLDALRRVLRKRLQ